MKIATFGKETRPEQHQLRRSIRPHVAKSAYVSARLNRLGEPSWYDRLPGDGRFEETWKKIGKCHLFEYRYTEGPRDKAWMERQDRRYLTKLATAEDDELRARFRREMASLDLSLAHHRNLQDEFARYLDGSRPAAEAGSSGGGEGGSDAEAGFGMRLGGLV